MFDPVIFTKSGNFVSKMLGLSPLSLSIRSGSLNASRVPAIAVLSYIAG